jgi:PAS domain S-box-containing protein
MINVIIPGIKKRSRWLWLTGALFLFVVLAVPVLARNLTLEKKSLDPLTTAERAWLKAHPVIRLAPDPDFPPVEYFDKNGKYSGITADYVELMEKKLGIRIEIIRLRNWEEIISKAKNRQIDAYVATKTPQRAEYLLFTKPFLEFPVVILTREKVKGPLTLEKLHGMKVSVVSEYAAHNFIAYNYPKLQLDLVPDVQTGLRKVAFGLSDVFVENLATVTYYIEKGGITNLRIAGESGYFYRMGFCTRKDWPELNRILEKGLAEISADEQKAIYKKWIPVEPRSLFTSREFQTGLVVAVATILLIVAGFIAWNRALAQQVRLRTGELEKELAERKRMEEELERARDGLKKRVEERTGELAETVQALRFTQFAVDRSTDQAFWMTNDGHFFYVNDAACHALGYTRDELLTMSVMDIDPKCPPEMVVHYWQVLRENGADTFETCHRAKDGCVYPVEIRSNLLIFEGKEYTCCFVTDITKRKRAEEALRESGERLKMAMDLARLVQWEYDVESGMFTFDDQFYALYGTTAEREGGTLMSVEDYARKFMPPEESTMVAGGITEVLANSCNQLEHRIIRADGEERFIVVRGEAVRDQMGYVVKIRGANQDITERKLMEEQLRKSEMAQRKLACELAQKNNLHRTLIDAIPDLIFYKDCNRAYLGCNKAFEAFAGRPEKDLVSRTDLDIFNRDVAVSFREMDLEILSTEESRRNEEWIDYPDGRYVLLETLKTPFFDLDGEILGVVGVSRDITERKKMEEELLLSQFCIDKAGIGIYQSDETGTIFRVNEHACKSLGYSSEELCALSVFDIDPEITREKLLKLREILDEKGSMTIETTHRRRDGTTFPVEITGNLIDFHGKTYVFSFVKDITERKRAIAELELTQFLVDKASIGIHRISEEGNILYANEYTCRTLGYTPEELCSMTVFDIDPSFNHEKFREHRKTMRTAGSRTFESIHRRKDGSTFPVEITVNYLESQDKELDFNVSFAKDITERKRAEEALKHAKEEWERTFASVPDLIAILDNQHRVLRVNEAMGKRLGLKPDECIGLHCYEAIHGLSEPPPFCPHTQTLMDGRKHVVEVHEERLGGDFLVSTTPLDDERGVMIGSVHIAYDITERKRAEEALRESESRVRRKLESILDPEGDTGELDLADILDAPQIQALMDDLYRITGLKMSIIDLKGRVLADVGWQDICSKFHRVHPETRKRCNESDTDLTAGIPPGEFRTYRCKNNMWHLVTPIFVGGRHMGNLFMGQFFFADEQIDYDLFRSQARRYGFPEEEYIAALEAVPRHSEELVNLGKAVFLRLTDIFSKLSYANIKLVHSLAERDRLTETLSKANLVVENSPVVLFRWKGGDEWPVELVSRNIIQFGYTPDEFLSGSITYSSIIHPDDLERVTREVHDFCDGGADQFRLEYRIRTKGGDIRWVNENSNIERDAAGVVKNFEGIVIDVTERKRAEDSIRASRAKYQALVDSFDGLIYISSQDYLIEFMNRKLIERTGRDAVGEYCYKVMHDRDVVCPWCLNDRVFKGEVVHREMFSPKDNCWYYAVNVPIRHADGSMSKHSMIIDINDRKLFEEELQRQKKMLEELNENLEKRVGEEVAKNREKDIMLIQQNRQAALGEMLDHIAHQWKQPLTSLSLVIQDLGETASVGELTDDHVKETVSITMSLLDHMTQTMDVFRGFYRPDKEKKVFSIKDSIDQALAFISPSFMFHSIAVEIDVDPGLTTFGYPKEYSQVLLNILANARDVFRKRGTEKPRVIIKAFAEGTKTVVTVKDNAGGIPETIIDKIFDFYFTTNESGDGTGIGLYMSKNIIEKNMGGTLSAVNTDGGAQFRIEISPI